MLTTVAGSFSFTLKEIETMPYSKLVKWYDRAVKLEAYRTGLIDG